MSETDDIKVLFEHVEKVIKDQIAPVNEAIKAMSSALSAMTDKVSTQQAKMAVLEERIKNEKEDRATAFGNIENKMMSSDAHRVKGQNQLYESLMAFKLEMKEAFKERDVAHERQQNKKLVIIGLIFTAVSLIPVISGFLTR